MTDCRPRTLTASRVHNCPAILENYVSDPITAKHTLPLGLRDAMP